MAHGDILRRLTEVNQTPWANAEVRAYRFKSDDDEDAELVKVDGEVEKEGSEEPTSSEMRN